MAKTNKTVVQREQELRSKFNQFWNKVLNSQSKDYFGNLNAEQMIELKQSLSDVNNIITMRTTTAFVKELLNRKIIDKNQYNAILKIIDHTNPNSPGFDINYADIIAEVKCNIPADGNEFGQAQIAGIERDINNLLNGKGKLKGQTFNYYKFFVLLDDGQYVTHAMNNLINSKNWINLIKEINQFALNDKKSIYLVFIPINSI